MTTERSSPVTDEVWRGSDIAIRNLIAAEIWRYQGCVDPYGPFNEVSVDGGDMKAFVKQIAIDEAEGVRKVILKSSVLKAYFLHHAQSAPWPSREVVAREIRRAMLDNPTEGSFNKRSEKREAIANEAADALLARFASALPSTSSAPEGAWQPIETAPKDRNVYLSDGDETKFPWVDYWDAEYGWWRIARELGAKPEPKFWMEIPAFTSTPSAPGEPGAPNPLADLLREVRDRGLIYWEPQTARGAMAKMFMIARIDTALSSDGGGK